MENSEPSKAGNGQTQNDPTPRSLHTPGPWLCHKLLSPSENRGEASRQGRANALLISTAPKLLEKSRALIHKLAQYASLGFKYDTEFQDLVAAIAEAEGAPSVVDGNDKQLAASSSLKSESVFNQGRAQ